MDEVKMLVSCVVEKEGRKIVRVSFLRGMEEERSMDYAEGILPDGIIVKSEGFSGTEVQIDPLQHGPARVTGPQAPQLDHTPPPLRWRSSSQMKKGPPVRESTTPRGTS